MRRAVIAVLLVAAAAGAARAAYEDLGAGARAAGMANAFAPVADDIFAIYYNPAGLGGLERPELGTAYSLLHPGLTDGSSLGTSFIGYAQPLSEGRYGTLGTAWNAFTLNSSLYRDDSFYLSYGKLLINSSDRGNFYGGLSMKYLRSSFGNFAESGSAVPTNGVVGGGRPDPLLTGPHSNSAFDLDLGLLYRPDKHYSAGLSLVHANEPNIAFGTDPDRLPLLLKVGFNYHSLLSNLSAEFDTAYHRGTGREHTVLVGAERWFPHAFSGDLGARLGAAFSANDNRELDAGVSFRTRRFQADYAIGIPFGTVNNPVSGHRVSLSFRFGRKTEEEESLEMVLEAMKQLKAGHGEAPAAKPADLSRAERATLEEYLVNVRGLESRAQYWDALQKFNEALQVAPADKRMLDGYGRLSLVAQQIKSLPDYKSDPLQASLHLGLLAYIQGYNMEAMEKISYAYSLRPEWKELDAFLTQLESITGIKRALFANRKKGDAQTAIKLARANAAIQDGYDEEAIDLSLAVLRVEPENAAAWENLGTAYFALKNYDESQKAWEKALKYESSSAVRAAIKQTIASIRRAKDRSHEIKRSAAAAAPAPAPVPQVPERPHLSVPERQKLFDEAIDHYTRREYPQAKALLEKIVAADPDDAEAQKALARVKDALP